jgi:hypothetical protein
LDTGQFFGISFSFLMKPKIRCLLRGFCRPSEPIAENSGFPVTPGRRDECRACGDPSGMEIAKIGAVSADESRLKYQ